MKTNSFIGRTGLWAVGLCLLGWAALAVSCTGMGREELTQGENASLTVTLSGQVPVSKAVGSPDDAEAVKEAENKLHNVTVFVFNSNGTLDKKHTFAPNQISANEARKSNVKQCTNKPLIKSNKHLLMND